MFWANMMTIFLNFTVKKYSNKEVPIICTVPGTYLLDFYEGLQKFQKKPPALI
jgi:hypothetical protein